MVTPEERRALLNLKPTEPALIVTVRADLYHDGLLEQDQRGRPLMLWWTRRDIDTNRITLAFGPER